MPQYKYTYFNVRGRGEIVRYMFAAAGVAYEDKRIDMQTEWPALKTTLEMGMVPILEIDGVPYTESVALTRHLAREFGFDGKTSLDKLQTDVLVDQVITLREKIIQIHFEKDETRKAELVKKFKEETIPKYFGRFEKLLKANKSGYLVGSELTYADIVLMSFSDILGVQMSDVPGNYETVLAHRRKIESLPRIAAYIQSRPVTHV